LSMIVQYAESIYVILDDTMWHAVVGSIEFFLLVSFAVSFLAQ
jgi:hypothetical protein